MRGCLIGRHFHLCRLNPWLLELDSGMYVYVYIYGSFLCIHSASLCLLVTAFNLFAFKISIDLQVSIVIFPNWGLFLFATLKSYGNSKSKTTIDTYTHTHTHTHTRAIQTQLKPQEREQKRKRRKKTCKDKPRTIKKMAIRTYLAFKNPLLKAIREFSLLSMSCQFS